MEKKIHEGRNVRRFRELLGIKQDTLAAQLGDDWNQKKISLLEQKESIEPDILDQVAAALKIPTEALTNFDEETAVNVISNAFTDCEEFINGTVHQFKCDFGPEDKWIEAMSEQRKLVAEIQRLHEQIIKEKEDKMELYERLLAEMKKY